MREYKSRITSGTASLIVNILFLVADKLTSDGRLALLRA